MAKIGVNKVLITGNLGQDAEVKDTANGKMVILSVATGDRWTDKQTQEKKDRTDWHRITVFTTNADYLSNYAKKGALVHVEAELKNRKYQDETGKDVYSTDIVVQGYDGKVQILSLAKTGDSQQSQPAAPSQSAAPAPQSAPKTQSAPPIDDYDDDIPF